MTKLRLFLLSVFSGLLMAAAWPAHGFTPLIFIAWVPLFFIQQYLGDSGKRGMFGYSFTAFLIWNTLTTWWIWNATPSGAVIAIILNSIFMAIVFEAFHLSKKWLFNNRKGFGILIFYWITWEFFHMNWDLSWPWLTLGNVFASKPSWIQWYEYTGTLGGTFWVLLVNILIYKLIQNFYLNKKLNFYLNFIIFIVITGLPFFISFYIFNNYKETNKPVQVVVVQPDIDPYTQEFNLPADTILKKNFAIAESLLTDSTKYLLLPESTLQDNIWENTLWRSPSLKYLQKFVQKYPNLSIIVGASTFRWLNPGEKKTHAARHYKDNLYYYAYNTAFFIDKSPYIQVHHKSKLVPGVEKMPSWVFLQPLEKYAINLGGVVGSLGVDKQIQLFTNNQSDTQIAPLICYESVYGDYVAKMVKMGASAIFVITNDGWWGKTPGYRQHFLFDVLRAIETRRDVAQASTTGISGFINQKGEILQQTKYWQKTALKQNVNLNTYKTYYVKQGDYFGRVSSYISVLILLVSIVQGILKKQKSLF